MAADYDFNGNMIGQEMDMKDTFPKWMSKSTVHRRSMMSFGRWLAVAIVLASASCTIGRQSAAPNNVIPDDVVVHLEVVENPEGRSEYSKEDTAD